MGSKEALNALQDPDYNSIYQCVFGKFKELWKLKNSRLQSEQFKRYTKRELKIPHRIRWMGEFEAVSNLYLSHF